MISMQCDICKKNTTNLKTVILSKKVIDYCPNCEKKVDKILSEFKDEMLLEYLQYESRIMKMENIFYTKKIKEKNNG